MVTKKKVETSTGGIAPKEAAATATVSRTMRDILRELASSIAQGAPWHQALLEAVGRWPLADEEVNGVRHRYILMGEAFDWLALAGRLLDEVDGLVPPGERDALLFNNRLPDDVSESGFADYLLYAKGKVIGVVEAKPAGYTLQGVITQSEKYQAGLPENVPAYHRPIPFAYESTGVCPKRKSG